MVERVATQKSASADVEKSHVAPQGHAKEERQAYGQQNRHREGRQRFLPVAPEDRHHSGAPPEMNAASAAQCGGWCMTTDLRVIRHVDSQL